VPVSGQPGVAAGLLARGYAFVVVSLRYLIVPGWAAVVVLAIMFLPPLSATSAGGLSQLVPPGSAAARAEADAARLFGFPIDAAVAVVQRDPHGLPAATRDRALRQALSADRRLPGQPDRAAGLPGARYELAGQTALTGDSTGSVFADLGRVALAIVVVTLVLLALFLRSLLAPVYLLAASVLAVFATLRLTILIGQDIPGYGSLVYFVPFAAGVLLVSLGSDYDVFVVGRIWEEARRRPVRDAVAVAAPQASRAVTTAGVALAASFAMLAVIPLEQFRQIAIAMALGVVLDAIAVRSLLVPALVALFGRLGMWPGNRRFKPAPAARPAQPEPAADPSRAIR
jgi:RND superfamily putative drug exporter